MPDPSACPPDARDILTVEQVAAWLQVHPRQVQRLGVPCRDLGHKTVRYHRKDVEAWLEERRVATGKRPRKKVRQDAPG